MSCLIVQVGQCGNQIGLELIKQIHKQNSDNNVFFTTDQTGRKLVNAVLIDMEQKVVSNCLTGKKSDWCYNKNATVISSQGSGNNWANGYNNFGVVLKDEICHAVRLISESLSRVSCVYLIMSCAGGTGSGLGTRVTELICDILPGALIFNQVVLPFSKGEVSVQCYNTALTLAALYKNADSILLTHNDKYQKLCQRLYSSTSHPTSSSFTQLNEAIAVHTAGFIAEGKPLDAVIEHCVPHPGYKLLTCRMMPVIANHCAKFSNNSWDMLGKYGKAMVLQQSLEDEGLIWTNHVNPNVCLSNYVVTRGKGCVERDISEYFSDPMMYHKLTVRALYSHNTTSFTSLDRSLFVLSNSKRNADSLDSIVGDSWVKFNAGAFLYQYEKFGLERTDFVESFCILEKVMEDYKKLKR